MAARRRAAEDKNIKILREIGSLPYNKQCFDCLQRGPTYVNVTIGSFVCTTCSGILRGLTLPHRVKSISMTTFSPDEIEFLKSRGNEYCKYVWLGMYDFNSNNLESEVSDDQKKRDFMVQKYEKKKWYVEPDIAVKKMQSDQMLKQKNSVAQTQNYNSSNNNLPETQPLSRLLGKSPTPIVVQNHQPAETWPHPVSSASAPSISTKTTAQNHGSRSIDLLSELAGDSSVKSSAQGSSSSTANGNFANFADFETAFSSSAVEKTAGTVTSPSTNLPLSASLDAYPTHSKQSQDMSSKVISPPVTKATINVSAPVTTSATSSSQQSSADRYAALADLDSLFHQPTTSKVPSWTVETSSSASLFDVPVTSERSTFNAVASNPFTSTELWSQPQVTKASAVFQSANPFQSTADSNLAYTQPSGSQAYAPFPIPMVGNSPSEDNMRNQFNANFAAFPVQVTSPTNGYGTNQMILQNGGFTSPPPPVTGTWAAPPNVLSWPNQPGAGGLFTGDIKQADPVQHSDWIQNPINPFMASQSSNIGFPVAPRSNSSNPFL